MRVSKRGHFRPQRFLLQYLCLDETQIINQCTVLDSIIDDQPFVDFAWIISGIERPRASACVVSLV
jgi:hypothetical protein